jgi:hypothetical protein
MALIGYGNLNTGDSEYYTVELIAGVNYRIYVDSAIPEVDFDVYVADVYGNVLTGENSTDSDALCWFTPEKSAKYRIYVVSASGSSSYRLHID